MNYEHFGSNQVELSPEEKTQEQDLRNKFNMPTYAEHMFTIVTDNMRTVLNTIFHKTSELTKYEQPVPMEVLRLLNEIKMEKMTIRSNETYSDNILIGKEKEDYNHPEFIIVRWGEDKLQPYDKLKEIALQTLHTKITLEGHAIISEIQNYIKHIKQYPLSELKTLSFYKSSV